MEPYAHSLHARLWPQCGQTKNVRYFHAPSPDRGVKRGRDETESTGPRFPSDATSRPSVAGVVLHGPDDAACRLVARKWDIVCSGAWRATHDEMVAALARPTGTPLVADPSVVDEMALVLSKDASWVTRAICTAVPACMAGRVRVTLRGRTSAAIVLAFNATDRPHVTATATGTSLDDLFATASSPSSTTTTTTTTTLPQASLLKSSHRHRTSATSAPTVMRLDMCGAIEAEFVLAPDAPLACVLVLLDGDNDADMGVSIATPHARTAYFQHWPTFCLDGRMERFLARQPLIVCNNARYFDAPWMTAQPVSTPPRRRTSPMSAPASRESSPLRRGTPPLAWSGGVPLTTIVATDLSDRQQRPSRRLHVFECAMTPRGADMYHVYQDFLRRHHPQHSSSASSSSSVASMPSESASTTALLTTHSTNTNTTSEQYDDIVMDDIDVDDDDDVDDFRRGGHARASSFSPAKRLKFEDAHGHVTYQTRGRYLSASMPPALKKRPASFWLESGDDLTRRAVHEGILVGSAADADDDDDDPTPAMKLEANGVAERIDVYAFEDDDDGGGGGRLVFWLPPSSDAPATRHAMIVSTTDAMDVEPVADDDDDTSSLALRQLEERLTGRLRELSVRLSEPHWLGEHLVHRTRYDPATHTHRFFLQVKRKFLFEVCPLACDGNDPTAWRCAIRRARLPSEDWVVAHNATFDTHLVTCYGEAGDAFNVAQFVAAATATARRGTDDDDDGDTRMCNNSKNVY